MSHPFKIAATKISADGNRFRSSFKLLFFILAVFIAVPGLLTIHSPADVFAGPTDSKEECEAAGGQWTMVAIDNCVNYTVDPNATDPNSSKEACEAAGKQWLIMQIGTLRCVDKVGANSTVSKLTIDKQALSYALVNSFTKCIQDEQYQQVDSINLSAVRWFYINDDNAKSGKWWFTEGGMLPWIRTDGASKFASYLSADVRTSDNGGDGRTLCNNILSQAKNLWEYPSALDFLCDGGLTRDDGSPCQGSIIRFGDISGSEKAKAIRGGITRKAYGGATPNLKIDAADGYPGLYVLYKAALEQGCRAAPSSESADSKYVHQIKVVSKRGDGN